MSADPVAAAAALLGDRVRCNVALGPLTTYRVGGPAALFMEAGSEDDLQAAKATVTQTGVEVLVVGKGSNLLVADAGFVGLAVTLGPAFADISVGADGMVRAGAAAQLPVLARKTAAAGLTGLEWAVGVPGSVGGAIRMNAGGHGSDTASVLRRFSFVDLGGGADGEFEAARLAFSYRHSTVEPRHVVTSGLYQLEAGDRVKAEAAIAEIVRWRRQHQPGGQNAGSVFTNPPGDAAGRLIDDAGLKGRRRGTAQVSEKHANFIQADEGGSADDVWALMHEIRQVVEECTGVRLAWEVKTVGFKASTSAGGVG